jgi:hypothetical protein
MDSSRHDRAADGRPAPPTPAEGAAPALPGVAGLAETAAGDFAPVLHLASIAQALARAMPAPYSRARAVVLQRLQADGAALFIAPGDELDEARPVLDADEWRPELASGAESLARWQRLQAELLVISMVGANMDPDEALWRGVPLVADAPEAGACIGDDERRALPPLPPLHGRAGALEAWRVAALPGATRSGVEFVSQALALGIFELDAVRLFPELPWERSFWEGTPALVEAAPAPAHHLPLSFPLPDRPQPAAAPAPVVPLWPAPAPAAAAAAPAPAPATAGRSLIRTPRERWRNARGHWSDEVLAEADRLLSPSGGNHSEDKVAQALGIKRQSLQEALRRWTARADKGKAAASA